MRHDTKRERNMPKELWYKLIKTVCNRRKPFRIAKALDKAATDLAHIHGIKHKFGKAFRNPNGMHEW